MEKHNKDWFSVSQKFTVSNAEELNEYLMAACKYLLTQSDNEYAQSSDDNLDLAKSMLENIGVKCI